MFRVLPVLLAMVAFIPVVSHADEMSDIMEKQRIIRTLEEDILSLDRQLADCKKKKKGWVAATVVGGVGTIGTGIGVIVQANKLSDKKDELKEKTQELSDKKDELNSYK